MFNNFQAVQNYLNSLINYEEEFPLGGSRSRPKLDPSLQAVSRLHFSRELSNCIHIVGTVGKGSIAAFCESILSTRHRTLSFTSPHLLSVKERVTLNGKPLTDDFWCRGFSEIFPRLAQVPAINLTYFEMVWIFYLWASHHLQTSAHVVEAGLGGSWDATNILQDTVAVVAVIDLDHSAILGNTPQEIARDKSGIIKPYSHVVVSPQPHNVLPVIWESAEDQSAALHIFGNDYDILPITNGEFTYNDPEITVPSIRLKLRGTFQTENSAVAIRACRLIDPELSIDDIRSAVSNTIPRARQQLLEGTPQILVDVAHNPASFRTLAETLRKDFLNRNITAVFAMMKDKDSIESLKHLRGIVNKFYLVEADTPRTTPTETLLSHAKTLGLNAEIADRLTAFGLLSTSEIDIGLVTGSFYLVGDYLSWRDRARTT